MGSENFKILLVDDESDILEIISYTLKSDGYLVYTAENGVKAIELAKKVKPDLIILDVMMPGEDGLSLTKKLLNKYLTPIILLTARKETSDRIIGLETGADDYISKPFEPRELILRIESIFKRIKKFGEKKSIKDISIGILKFD